MNELNMLVKRCLTYGIEILPYAQDGVFDRYEKNKLPDYVLAKLNKAELNKYVKALFLCSCEMAGDWTKGHELLKELGFVEKRREQGHRVFLSLVYEEIVATA
jgi:hypothetical protein